MIVIGFTGTQKGMTVKQANVLHELIEKYKIEHSHVKDSKPLHFHHGDCIGADEEAHVIARDLDAYIVVHPPVSNRKRAFCDGNCEEPMKPYLERNHRIVDLCDVLIACPNSEKEELRSGTWATIRYAKKQGVKTIIIYPNGCIDEVRK